MSDDPTEAIAPTGDSSDDAADSAPAPAAGSPSTAADAPSDRNADVPTLAYEAARDELASIVTRLEGGSLDLEESMRLWERGEALAAHCSRWLDGAEARLARAEGTQTD